MWRLKLLNFFYNTPKSYPTINRSPAFVQKNYAQPELYFENKSSWNSV